MGRGCPPGAAVALLGASLLLLAAPGASAAGEAEPLLSVSPSRVFVTPGIPVPLHIRFQGRELDLSQVTVSLGRASPGRVRKAVGRIELARPWRPGEIRLRAGGGAATVPVELATIPGAAARRLGRLAAAIDAAGTRHRQAAREAELALGMSELAPRTRRCREVVVLGTWVWRASGGGAPRLTAHDPMSPRPCNIDRDYPLRLASFRVTRLSPFTHPRLRDPATDKPLEYARAQVEARFAFARPLAPDEWMERGRALLWEISATVNWFQTPGFAHSRVHVDGSGANLASARWFVDDLLGRDELCPDRPAGLPCHPAELVPAADGFSLRGELVGIPGGPGFFEIAVGASREVDLAHARRRLAERAAALVEAFRRAMRAKLEAWEQLRRLQQGSSRLSLGEVLKAAREALDLKLDLDGLEVGSGTLASLAEEIDEPLQEALTRRPRLAGATKNLVLAAKTFGRLQGLAQSAASGGRILDLLVRAEKRPEDALTFIGEALELMDAAAIAERMGPWTSFYGKALGAVADAVAFLEQERFRVVVDSGLPCERVAVAFADPQRQARAERLCRLRDLMRRVRDPDQRRPPGTSRAAEGGAW